MESKSTALTLQKEEALNQVTLKIRELSKNGKIAFPPNYSVANSLNSAWLMLQEIKTKDKSPVLEKCTKNSIVSSLYDMCLQGLSPAKKQCYFVAYGNQLQLMRSYMGTVAVTKRLKGIKDVKAYCIYEGDEFEETYDPKTANITVTKFEPKFENIDIDKIKGAFAVVIGENGPVHTEVMNINQIKKAWNQGYAKGNSGAHNNFTDQMAKKTVINRACKMYANTSDDSDLLIEAFNNSDKNYDENKIVDNAEYEVKEEIKEAANKKEIDFKENNQDEKEIKSANENENVIDVDIKEQKGPGF